MSQLFASGCQSIGVSASTSVFPMNTQEWPLYDGLVGSPCSPRDSQESFQTPQFKSVNSSVLSFLYVQLSHPYLTTGKTIALTTWTFVGKVMSLLFNTLSRLVIAFLPRSKCLLISWLQSPSAVILDPPKMKSATVSTVSSIYCFIDYAKAFVWITINCGKIWKRWEYQTTWPPSWETCMQVRK